MNAILDNALVGLALVVSAGYALSALGPRSLRRRLLARLSWAMARAAAGAPAVRGLRRLAARLASASAGKAQGACGGCGDCGPAKDSPAAEISVPVGKIGRRG